MRTCGEDSIYIHLCPLASALFWTALSCCLMTTQCCPGQHSLDDPTRSFVLSVPMASVVTADAASPPSMSRPTTTLFSPTKHRASNTKRNVLAVARAVTAVMQRELGQDALLRWQELLDAELGQSLFRKVGTPKRVPRRPLAPLLMEQGFERVNAVEKVVSLSSWVPKRPKLALLLLAAFQRGDELLADGKPLLVTAYTADGRALSKLLSKRAIDWIQQQQPSAFISCDELAPDQISDAYRLQKVVGRTAADVLSYVHSVASASRVGGGITLELHRTDQRLAGIETRGSGVVFCSNGRELFNVAITKMISWLAVSRE